MATALVLEFPAPATRTAERTERLGSYALPTGPWKDGTVPGRIVEGPVEHSAWRIAAPGMTTLQLLAPLRAQLAAAGFQTVWECETDTCGGFDFRFGTDVLPEPDMHVDLGDFRFLSAERPGADGPQTVSLLVSRSSDSGFVQVVTVGDSLTGSAPAGNATVIAEDPLPTVPDIPDLAPGLSGSLQRDGFVVLEDLVFKSGSAELDAGRYDSLAALAEYLRADAARSVALVGHTDASGSLAGNTTLSRARAASVRQQLISGYAVPASQITAEGVGYLAPRTTNLTAEGRARNRRVEAVLTSKPG
jgi:OOP family OmpA-OmpF porin